MEKIYQKLNKKQREVLSTFFITIGAAWFIAVFVTPQFDANVKPLTLIMYLVNMMLSLVLAISLLKE